MNGIRIQVGVVYGTNRLLTLGRTLLGTTVHGWSGHSDPNADYESDVDVVKFSTFSIPFSIRVYPGDARQFALHGGLRLVMPIGEAKQLSLESNNNDGSKRLSPKGGDTSDDSSPKKAFEFLFGNKPGNDLKIKTHLTFDFGFSYNAKSGFIIGMRPLQ